MEIHRSKYILRKDDIDMNFNITKKEFNNEDMTYTAYGIQANSGIISMTIDDISTKKEQVCLYIKKLESEPVSFACLPELVSEYIGQSLSIVM